MAVRYFYPETGTTISLSGWTPLTETYPGLGLCATGFLVGKTSTSNWCLYDHNTENSGFTSSPEPGTTAIGTGQGLVFPTAITGDFAATDWTIALAWNSDTNASGQEGRVNCRVWKSTSTDISQSSGRVELTSARLVGTNTTTVGSGSASTSTITWSPGAISLSSEYLWFQLAWEITTQGGNSKADVWLYSTSLARVTTPDFSTSLTASGVLGGTASTSAMTGSASLTDVQLYQRTTVGAGI